ncbi:MAG: endopeptidase La [Spirochaetes bacterium]|nr:endopeptidase La [Spirochaetota bacterium]
MDKLKKKIKKNIDTNNNSDNDNKIVLAEEIFPDKLIIIPMFNRPLFPGMMIPLIISGKEIVKAIEEATKGNNKLIGTVLAKEQDVENRDISNLELYEYGTIAKIHKINQFEENAIQILIQGIKRFKKVNEIEQEPIKKWKVEYFEDIADENSEELKAYTLEIISSVKELLKLNSLFHEQLRMLMSNISSEKPGKVLDLIASMTTAESEQLQELIETVNLLNRAKKLLIILKKEIEVSILQDKIKKSIDEKISQQQKKFFLHEQLKLIKKELGLEKDDKSAEIEKFENRIKKIKLSEEAEKVVTDELNKLKLLEQGSSEYHIVRTYLDWITELPWGIFSKDQLNIQKAKKILDKTHYGLNDIKERILEFISTAKKRGKLSGSIICLVGPPGVGKTSIGKSIADALNRKFFRFSVGGMRDEAEIKGHRRTYIGAMPGKIIQSLKKIQTTNPVIMIDEIDKIGASFHGDPASALLEVLDPEQNRDFLDHYLDIRYDLSNILFITTANQLDTIPPALIDRMEIMHLSGYILEEKLQIAKKFLLPEQINEHGLNKNDISLSDKTIKFIIDKYAREAGIRNLEKQLKKIMRKTTFMHAEGKIKPATITLKNIEKYLGKPIFSDEELYNKGIPGVTLGLAWTSMGGATLYIEASGSKSKTGGFKQTGQLGKVMLESSEIAYSYIKAKLCKNDSEKVCFFDENFIHLHVPAGATPKDGPSAGITMALALYSLVMNKPVRNDIAMTGEITLTGKVLPIGGVKEKTLAARRVGIFEIILPKDNKRDFDLLPDHLKKGMIVNYVDYFDDVLKVIYNKNNI